MSRKKASDSGGGKFKRLLGWTVLMAIVFSAGLITGERLVRKQSLGPLVSITDQVVQPSTKGAPEEGDEVKEETTFAFFDKLTQKDDVALSSKRAAENKKPAAKKKADTPAPEAKPAEQEAKTKAKQEAKSPEPKEAPAEKAAPEDEPAAQEVAARYTLQVAAHPDMDSAKSHMERLRKMGLEPHLISAAIPGKGKFYRVRVGKFGSMDEARSFQDDLKRKNSLSTFVSPL
jgi:cell division septation protein DedD